MPDEREIMTWDIFGTASRDLAQMVADSDYEPDMVLAIARGGLLIGGAIGYALSVKNVYTMNVEFYTGVDERLEVPRILPPAPDFVDLAHAKLLIVDDVATAAIGGVITAENAPRVKAPIIIEAANAPVQPAADDILDQPGAFLVEFVLVQHPEQRDDGGQQQQYAQLGQGEKPAQAPGTVGAVSVALIVTVCPGATGPGKAKRTGSTGQV